MSIRNAVLGRAGLSGVSVSVCLLLGLFGIGTTLVCDGISQQQGMTGWGPWGLASLISETSPCGWGLWRPPGVGLCMVNTIYSFAILPSSRRRGLLSQADDPCPGPRWAGGTALLFVLVPVSCYSTEAFLELRGGVQCQVIAPRRLLLLSTALLQPHSFYRQLLLLQNPFSNPGPQQVLDFASNECIKGGLGRLEPTGCSHKFRCEMSSALLPGWRLITAVSLQPSTSRPSAPWPCWGSSLVWDLPGTSVPRRLR